MDREYIKEAKRVLKLDSDPVWQRIGPVRSIYVPGRLAETVSGHPNYAPHELFHQPGS